MDDRIVLKNSTSLNTSSGREGCLWPCRVEVVVGNTQHHAAGAYATVEVSTASRRRQLPNTVGYARPAVGCSQNGHRITHPLHIHLSLSLGRGDSTGKTQGAGQGTLPVWAQDVSESNKKLLT